MEQTVFLVAAVATTFFLAGMVKGVTGMGLPTVAMGVLGALLSPLTAAALLLLPSFITNVWQLVSGPHVMALLRRLWPMMVTITIGTLASSALLAGGDTRLTTSLLGGVLVIYASYTLLARPLRVSTDSERWASPLIGLVTGVVTGGTGVFVIPAVPYLQALGFEKDDLVQALGLSFTVSTIALAAGLFWHGAVPKGDMLMSTLAIIPALLGMAAGQAIRARISPPVFRRVFLIGLLLLGLEMALRIFR